MGFWATLWKKPKRAYQLGGVALLLGFALGALGLWEKDDIQAKFGCVLGAAFCFALWSLFSCVGVIATYAATARRAFEILARGQMRPPDSTS